MIRPGFVIALLWIGAGPVLGQSLSIQTADGGGAIAQSGTMKLSGAIDGYGLPDGSAGTSFAGAIILEISYYPSLIAILSPYNAADPIWLQVVRLMEPRPAAREPQMANRTKHLENP